MRFLFILFILFPIGVANSEESNFTWVDGVITFRQGHTPSKYELAVSTTLPDLAGIDDYRNILTSKPYIAEKVLGLEMELIACQSLRIKYPSVAGVQGKINKLIAQIDLLVALYLSLP